MGVWTYDETAGDLLVLTGVEGPAARMGHALTLRWTRWRAEVEHAEGTPTSVRVTVPVDGVEVVRGEGGVKGLSGPEKAIVRRRALKELGAAEHPTVELHSEDVTADRDGWRVAGTLRIRGRSRPFTLRLRDEGGVLRAKETLRQTDFGVTPVRFLGGAFSVSDEVRVRLDGVAVPTEGYAADRRR
ncbi:YceI family protein [Nocardioides marmoribigeumensis]|uniref:Polyisoprenoid-binding protein YceI n=1 Tax=Nocardioides marmoribigeumensis TaxID=433649 RepID=A0ABU2BYE6_9ACTN|nr:YceI family protein [Nocardioides marmoribigeumensis]MDR7363427.1 polyisoprenoid-binding protein YceI [Nocardioides marmoribigeumensis]